MKEFTANHTAITTQSAVEVLNGNKDPNPVKHYGAFIGLDVHKESIAVAVAKPDRAPAAYNEEIASKPKSVAKLVRSLSERFAGEVLLFCYEAGPCGYPLYHQLVALGHDCQVVAPSQIPKKPGDQIKTDRRDAIKLAQFLRSGNLTSIWIPDEEQEAMRDLTRARCDMKAQEVKAKQQLNAFVLRHGRHWPGNRTRWTQSHFNWLEELRFAHDWQQVVLQEYIDAVKAATRRVADVSDQIERALPHWSMAPVVASLVALRGIDKLAAVILLAELGDISRFAQPKQLMAFLGLVPSEHSSGSRRRQGAITRAGNGHARRVLVESAWCYRFTARQTMHLKRKAAGASDHAKSVAWRAQKRLCGRYRYLIEAGKNQKDVCIAVARELVAFIWDVVCHETRRLPAIASM